MESKTKIKNSVDAICEVGDFLSYLEKLYKDFGYSLPLSCYTNHRDSWFHYRKMCQKRDLRAIDNEKYGIDEHLLRSVKDGMVYFLKKYIICLDVLHSIGINEINIHHIVDEELCKKTCTNINKTDWFIKLNTLFKDSDQFSFACAYYLKKELCSDTVVEDIKALEKKLKTIIFEYRVQSVSIYRSSDKEYSRDFIIAIDEIRSFQAKPGFEYISRAVEIIINNRNINFAK